MHTQFPAKTIQLVEFASTVEAQIKAGTLDAGRVRIRICRFGPSCSACGGAAWIRDCSQKKPRPGCKGRAYYSPAAKAMKAWLKDSLPNHLKAFIA